MTTSLVDTNIFVDILGPASNYRNWSVSALEICLNDGGIVINPVIWAELAASPLAEAQLVAALSWLSLKRESVPFEAAFAAGKAHRQYRLSGGSRERTLPDFLIGAHAAHARYRLLTRDAARYQNYFPGLVLITPETHP